MANMADIEVTAGYPSSPNYYSTSVRKHTLGSLYEQTQSMSSTSPSNSLGSYGAGVGQDQGPLLNANIGFLKGMTEKKTARDGQPAKRRGPKPDSKPALTRRQELNRQAQRTHRERKELYIKALEEEVLRLKEVYSNVSQDKVKLAEENKQLKSLLTQNGISPASAGPMDDMLSNPSLGYTSSGSVTGSYAPGSATAYTPSTLISQSIAPSMSATSQMMVSQQQHIRNMSQQQSTQSRVDYEQAGIDFVLTLEKPCMEHMPWLLDRAAEQGREPCGHALMASCPPEPFSELSSDVPFGHVPKHTHSEGNKSLPQTWELSKGDLATLLDLSKRLELDGEITPVMAWGMILGNPRLSELGSQDFQKLMDELQGKVRCYGFGAVMEEFEVRDALNSILSTKPDFAMVF